MKNATHTLGTRFGLESFSIEWEKIFGILAALCGITAIILGVVWMVLRDNYLLYVTLGFSLVYFIGRDLLPAVKINSVEQDSGEIRS
jgi:hypothetical protein